MCLRRIADDLPSSPPTITHPTASFYKTIQDDRVRYLMGILPSFTHTGRLASWMIEYLREAGGLVTLLICNHSEHNNTPYHREYYESDHSGNEDSAGSGNVTGGAECQDTETKCKLVLRHPHLEVDCSKDGWWMLPTVGYRFTTFGSGDDTLFHCRVYAGYASRASFAHREADMIVRYYTEVRDFGPTLQDHGYAGWINLTSYHGKELPWKMLKELYQLSGLDWSWKEGKRGQDLSSAAWDRLRRWDEETEDQAE